jgi:aryl-alcohol dehydrogenase-like predicted oxidoreductase
MSNSSLSSATVAGTKRFFEKLKSASQPHFSLQPAKLGRTGFLVSRIGFGGYRVHEHDPDHRESLRSAILSGVNLIDTSFNYTDGSSERMIGQTLLDMINEGSVKRDELVIVTKAGFIQGAIHTEAKKMKERGELWNDVIELPNDIWHSLSPDFLTYSITQSLERLKVDTIDVLLIHNPEVFFKASRRNIEERKLFLSRMQAAFKHLESEVARGRIKYYGVSSNGFPEPENQSTHVPLKKLYETAKLAAGSDDHHFAVVQFPFNLFEANPALFPQQEGEILLDVAKKLELGVLTNRPLNSLREGRVVRLGPFREHDPVFIKGELHAALGRAIELERDHPFKPKEAPQGLKWAHELREPLGELSDVLSWRDFALTRIYPSIRLALARVPNEAQGWRVQYETAIAKFLDLVTADLECLANSRARLLVENIDSIEPKLQQQAEKSLSARVISAYIGLPQIHTVLVGLRKSDYVTDLRDIKAPLTEAETRNLLTKMQRHKS